MTNTKEIIGRYDIEVGAWTYGYYQDTRFIITAIVRM